MTAEPCPHCGSLPTPKLLRDYASRMKAERDDLQARVDALSGSPAAARNVLEAAGLGEAATRFLADDPDDDEPDDGPTDQEQAHATAARSLHEVNS